MKKYALEYSGYKFNYTNNLGDEIQTLAAVRLLDGVDGFISREHLHEWTRDGLVSMNGFFLGSKNWPPSASISPVFFSFHLDKEYERVVCSPEGVAYLKRHQPIGCRDRGTADILKRYGIDVFYSRCVTLTFPLRTNASQAKDIFIVGVDQKVERVIPRNIRKAGIRINQSSIRLPRLSCELKRDMAQDLLEGYAQCARLVITSKIHCAMPCLALGIPVVFLYPADKRNDYRVHLVGDFIPINYVSRSSIVRGLGLQRLLASKINWTPEPVEMEETKRLIERGYAEAVQRALSR